MKEWTEKPTIFLNSEIHGLGAINLFFRLVKLGFAYPTGSKIDDRSPEKASEHCEAYVHIWSNRAPSTSGDFSESSFGAVQKRMERVRLSWEACFTHTTCLCRCHYPRREIVGRQHFDKRPLLLVIFVLCSPNIPGLVKKSSRRHPLLPRSSAHNASTTV